MADFCILYILFASYSLYSEIAYAWDVNDSQNNSLCLYGIYRLQTVL